MKNTISIIIAILLAALVFGALGYALSSMKEAQKTTDTEQADSIPSESTKEADASASLATAISLLPDPSLALGGRKMTDNLYWIWNTVSAEDGIQERDNTTWIVDINRKEVVETFTRKDFYPMEPKITFPTSGNGYFEVAWDNGWEGPWTKTNDFFDAITGKLAYTLIQNMGQEAVIQAGDTELSIMLDPTNGCVDAVTNPSKRSITVTGLSINETSYPFSEPETADCEVDELYGSGYYPEFKFIYFSPSESLIRLGLPWDGKYAEIPIPSLDPEQMEYK